MARPCTVCGHPSRAAVDASLRADTAPADVAAAHPPLSARAIARHHASGHHLHAPPRGPTTAAAAVAAVAASVAITAPTSPAPASAPGAEPKAPRAAPPPADDDDEHGDVVDILGIGQPVTKEARIGHCLGLIAADLWIDGVTGRQLAVEWRLSEGTIAHYQSEARRRLTSALDSELVTRIVATSLYRGTAAALAMVEGGSAKALSGLAALLRVSKDLIPAPATKDDAPPVFRVELSTPERPTAPELGEPTCPSGTSSPPGDDPAAG